MGWTTVKLEVMGRASSHNSDQDKKDDADWQEFCERACKPSPASTATRRSTSM